MNRVDLHVHSTASDGTLSPEALVDLAKEQGLSAIALTDHDTIAGIARGCSYGAQAGMKVIPGIEIGTRWKSSVHIVGLFIDPEEAALKAELHAIVEDRDSRNEKIIARMRADGLPVNYSDLKERFGEVIGRPHLAQILVENGLAESVKDAFARYVGRGMRYYESRHTLSLSRSIQLIRGAGGVPLLAHPFQYKLEDAELRALLSECISLGLQGMECRYSGYDSAQTAYLSSLCNEYALAHSGGSDFHGSNKPNIRLGTGIHGELSVPEEYLYELESCRKK